VEREKRRGNESERDDEHDGWRDARRNNRGDATGKALRE
jgi:hypothetical protein